MDRPIHRVVDLIAPDSQLILNMEPAEARRVLLGQASGGVDVIEGSFAMVARAGERVVLARSLDRPLRYFLAKETSGPLLVVADRIDAIRAFLEGEGYAGQFHPSYTRMVPAHHVTTIRLVGCPDPNPAYERFVAPAVVRLPGDLDVIGRQYIEALRHEVAQWLKVIPSSEPIGVLFSGGVDSGAVLLTVYRLLLGMGQSPSRLKAFTLSIDGAGEDGDQARAFLRRLDLEVLGETVEVAEERLRPLAAVEVIEDYKPRDVECATVNLALLEEIRRRYPGWRYLADGDGGDENLKDYPIEENPELTIVSVVNNPLLYHEGWGVDRIKHSLTYSGGQSRGCVRTFAPLRKYGFLGFSPFTRPSVVRVATAIPFDDLVQGSHEALYALKGEIVRRGMQAVWGMEMPVFEKRRFQEGATSPSVFAHRFAATPDAYREHFLALHRAQARTA
jgi:asparagine synthase (glutamine-hydrolysing)